MIQSANQQYDKKDVKNLNADKRAAARGQIVIEPKPNQLFVDIDCEDDLVVFRKNLGWLEGLVTGYALKPSGSGKPGHYHITVELSRDVKDGYERIGLQAILGSDRLREVLSWRNLANESGRPTVFFEKSTDAPIQSAELTPASQTDEEKLKTLANKFGVVSNSPDDWRKLLVNLLELLVK
jgi:hypothetical protein